MVTYSPTSMRVPIFLNLWEILACEVAEGTALDMGERQEYHS